MSELGLNVVKKSKVRSAHFTFLQHLTPSQTFITSKKINYDSEEKKVAKSRTRISTKKTITELSHSSLMILYLATLTRPKCAFQLGLFAEINTTYCNRLTV